MKKYDQRIKMNLLLAHTSLHIPLCSILGRRTKTFAPNSKRILATLKATLGKRAVYDTFILSKRGGQKMEKKI